MGEFPRPIWIGLLLVAACHPGGLVGVSGSLSFSSPDYPTAVQGVDGGLVRIDFGQVAVNSTKSLTLLLASISGTEVTLASLTPLRADPEFSLPIVAGSQIEPLPPSQIAADFSPTSSGTKTAVYSLAYSPPVGAAVTLALTGEAVPSGFAVTPNPVDFGNVELNQTQPVVLTVTNHADTSASLELSALQGANADRFILGVLPGPILAPGASLELPVFFAPRASGPASASFAISGIVGNGIADPPTTVTLGGTGVQTWLQVTAPLDFGYLPPGRTLVRSAELKNTGSFTTLSLEAPAPRISQSTPSSVFALASPQPALPLSIAPGQTAQIAVTFTPPILGRYSGTLSLATDDPGNPLPVISLDGHGGGPQILCLSRIDFGPVPLGHSGLQETVCVNAGTDIPGDPDGGLRIAQSDLGTTTTAFAASLVLPDGGLAGPGFGVSLPAGQSQAIAVTFQPADAGMYADRLFIRSSDLSDLDAGVALTGEGLVPGPCSVEISPLQLGFGEIPSGDTGLLPFEIDNTGQNLCVLSGITLDPLSDPAYSLPGGARGYQFLSFPGDGDNPAGLPTSLTVAVQFAPLAAEGAAAGSVDVTISNATPTDQAIALTATSAAACLTIVPPSYDFGVVGFSPSSQQLCLPDTTDFEITNGCAAAVTLTRLDVNSGVAPAPQFSLENGLQLPLSIAAGAQVGFASSFTPTAPGAKLGAITVSTSEFGNAPFLVTLQGDAEPAGSRTDTFMGEAPGKLDILWIVDEDGDFPQVNLVSSFLPAIVDAMDQEQIDYQIAVTSTDTCDGGSSDQGSFESCSHCLSKVSIDPLYVTPQTQAPAMALSDLFALFGIPPQLGVCARIDGPDHFFDAIAEAFSPASLAGHNAGFIRPGGSLAIVVVNGNFDDDGISHGTGGPYQTTLAQVTSLVQGLEPDPTRVSVSLVDWAPVAAGGRLIDHLVQATGGVEIDTSSPAPSWEAALPDFFTEGVGSFHLSSMPASPARMIVEVNGVVTPIWTYDSSLNDIAFPPADLPAPGSTIMVTYDLGCP